MNEDITRMLTTASAGEPDTRGWARNARGRDRRRRAVVGIGSVAVIALLAVPLAGLLGAVPDAVPVPAESSPVTTPVTTSTPPTSEATDFPSPHPPESESASPPPEVLEISYRQEALAAAHPAVFAGWDLTSDAAVLLFEESREDAARQLAAEAGVDGEHAKLEGREHSWVELMAMRSDVLELVEKYGLDVTEVVPDPRELDGITLALTPSQSRALDQAADETEWAALEAAGVRGHSFVEEPPEERFIHGLAVVNGVQTRGWFHLTVSPEGEQAHGVLGVREDLWASSGLSPFGDRMLIWVKADRLEEARDLVTAAGVDPESYELIPTRYSLSDYSQMWMPAQERATALGLTVRTTAPDVERGGFTLGIKDLAAAEGLSDAEIRSLRDLGVVSLEEIPEEITFGFPSDPEPRPEES